MIKSWYTKQNRIRYSLRKYWESSGNIMCHLATPQLGLYKQNLSHWCQTNVIITEAV